MPRKPKFSTPEEFDEMVDQYVADCETQSAPMTLPGLALFLGFADKSSLYQYQKRPGFEGSVRRARTLIEEYVVKRSLGRNAAGAIFLLKNMGYTDRQDPHSTAVQVVITGADARL